MEFNIVKNYKNNNKLRESFNELAKETFSIDFEDWYENGYWTEKYNPYSVEIEGTIVANVSVNTMDFIFNEKEVKLIQLGTVMTKEGYKNKGLIRILMEEAEKDYKDVDGVFLFANYSVLDFYPKFGFKKSYEYQCVKNVDFNDEKKVIKIPMNNQESWDKFLDIMKESIHYGAFEMKDNYELIMFYISKFMQDSVYYIEDLETYVIAEIEGEELILHNVFTKEEVELDKIIKAFGSEIKKVNLEFTPKDIEGYKIEEINDSDTTLFIKGVDLTTSNKLKYPSLSHA